MFTLRFFISFPHQITDTKGRREQVLLLLHSTSCNYKERNVLNLIHIICKAFLAILIVTKMLYRHKNPDANFTFINLSQMRNQRQRERMARKNPDSNSNPSSFKFITHFYQFEVINCSEKET